MNVFVIPTAEAAAVIEAHHYLGTLPRNSAPCFACEGNAAIAAYGPLHMPRGPANFVELRRLVRQPGAELSLSAFLAATLRELKSRGVAAVVTWADPAAGHHGGIYQATNWVYNEPRSYNWNSAFITETGETVGHREAFTRFGTSSKKKVLALMPGWRAVLPPPKYRYLMPLSISKAEALAAIKGIEKPYPKPGENRAPERPAHAQRYAHV